MQYGGTRGLRCLAITRWFFVVAFVTFLFAGAMRTVIPFYKSAFLWDDRSPRRNAIAMYYMLRWRGVKAEIQNNERTVLIERLT